MRKRLFGVLFAGAAAAAALTLGASTALAAADSVTVSDSTGSGGAYTASTTHTTLGDATTGATFTCTSSSASGDLPDGTYTSSGSVVQVASGAVAKLSFSDCTSPFGTVTVTTDTPDDIYVYNPTSSGETDGYIVNASGSSDPLAKISVLTCTFEVVGDAPGFFDNSGSTLNLDPSTALPSGTPGLTAADVSGCAGIIDSGNALTFSAYSDSTSDKPYTVSPGIQISASD
jgi:hypothetical protein